MKTNSLIGPVTGLVVFILLATTLDTSAQTSVGNSTIPVVTIQATDHPGETGTALSLPASMTALTSTD
jgi:hypothetical protein